MLINDSVVVFHGNKARVGYISKKKTQLNRYGNKQFRQVEYTVMAEEDYIQCKEDELFRAGDYILIYDNGYESVRKMISHVYVNKGYFDTTDGSIYYVDKFKRIDDKFIYLNDDKDSSNNEPHLDDNDIYDAGYIEAINDLAEFLNSTDSEPSVFGDAIEKIEGKGFREYFDYFISLHDNIDKLIEFRDTIVDIKHKDNNKADSKPIEMTYDELKDILGYDFKLKEV